MVLLYLQLTGIALVMAALVGYIVWATPPGGMNRDCRAVAPQGSPERAAYEAERLLARAKPRLSWWARTRAFLRLHRVVRAGDMLPRWYGVAWTRWQAREAVCFPIPLNVPVRWAYLGWAWFKRGGIAITGDAQAAYQQGRRDERASWLGYVDGPLD